jgi:hypothetical protein
MAMEAAIMGKAKRRVTCEKCGCAYEYELFRRGRGNAGVGFISQRKQAKWAGRRAQKSLDKRLRNGIDPVACPDCGWYQRSMAREMRRRRLRPLIYVGIIPPASLLAIVVVFVALQSLGAGAGHLDREDLHMAWSGVALAAGASLVSFLLREALLWSFDPNARYPERPAPYPGAPTPLRLDGTPVVQGAAQQVCSTPGGPLGYERRRPEILEGGWVSVQLATMQFPPICCDCMADTRAMHSYRVDSVTNVPLRMCELCSSRERRRLNVSFWIGLSLSPVFGALAFWILRQMGARDIVNALFRAAFLGLCASAGAGLLIYRILCRAAVGPVALRNHRPDLNTIEIRFRNSGYADLLLDAQRPAVSHVDLQPPAAG